eukprot:CFRG1392T1
MGSSKSKPAKTGPPPVKKKEITPHERAVLDLKNQRDRLHKYTKQLTVSVEKEKKMAKQALAAGNKQKALLFLKKKKYQESLLAKAEGQHQNIEEMVNEVEFASIQKEVFERLKAGKDVLEAINKEISLDDVDKLMDENAEAIAYQEQISDALGTQLTSQDEEDVLAELAALDELGDVKEVHIAEAKRDTLPDVPTHTPVETAEQNSTKPQLIAAE